MTKKDLKVGMVVENKRGNRYIVMGNFICRQDKFDTLNYYDEDLVNKTSDGLTIMKVYNVRDCSLNSMLNDPGELLWERPQYYNGKVVCINNDYNSALYTVGKIYEFKDGRMIPNYGEKFPSHQVHSFEDWSKRTSSKFIEVVE